MNFKYCKSKSLGFCKKTKKCFLVETLVYLKNGKGFIFYNNYLNKDIINTTKFIIYYFNINIFLYDIYLKIKPIDFKFYDNCIDLSIFFSIFFAFFKINMKNKIIIIGKIDFKNGKIKSSGNMVYKINFAKKNKNQLIITSFDDAVFFKNNKDVSFLKFKYLFEVYYFFKRCLAQRKSGAVTRRESRVQISQHPRKKEKK